MEIEKEKLTTRKSWGYPQQGTVVESVLFSDLFLKYLQKTEGKVCLEIGCVPGRFLSYLSKKFGYFPEGIDYIDGTKVTTEETLKKNGIKQFNIYEEDFITWDSTKQYDLICSFGFIEHFIGSLEEEVINKHIRLLRSGGKIILEVPNYRLGQHLIHLILDKNDLKRHNLKTMSLSYFNEIAAKNNLKIIYLGFYGGTFGFWINNSLNLAQKSIYYTLRIIEKALKKIKLNCFNNSFFSPYIIFIAEKLSS